MRKVRQIANIGMLLALAVALTAAEHALPPLPFLPPGVKLGLSNIAVMYGAFCIGRTAAATLTVLKSLFVFLTRGAVAGALSLCGGLVSVGVILLLLFCFREKISYAAVSVTGAVAHNLGQYAMASLLLSAPYFAAYLPVLLVSGVVMGIVTGTLLRVVMPALRQLTINN